jgi:hypothetical protein
VAAFALPADAQRKSLNAYEKQKTPCPLLDLIAKQRNQAGKGAAAA